MPQTVATDLLFIRHAPVVTPGILAGRTDVAADVSDAARAAAVARFCGQPDRIVTSGALRARQTAAAIWPARICEHDPRLWEQDFGDWDGAPFAEVPDIGPMSGAELAALRPPNGESYAAMSARMAPAFEDLFQSGQRIAVIAHAGTIRCALGHALGDAACGLRFSIANWSVTHLTIADGQAAIRCVNWNPDAA